MFKIESKFLNKKGSNSSRNNFATKEILGEHEKSFMFIFKLFC